jgi:hypothetical protein
MAGRALAQGTATTCIHWFTQCLISHFFCYLDYFWVLLNWVTEGTTMRKSRVNNPFGTSLSSFLGTFRYSCKFCPFSRFLLIFFLNRRIFKGQGYHLMGWKGGPPLFLTYDPLCSGWCIGSASAWAKTYRVRFPACLCWMSDVTDINSSNVFGTSFCTCWVGHSDICKEKLLQI